MLLINCEIILILTWSANSFIVAGITANQEPTFATTVTKRDAPLKFYQLKIIQNSQNNWNQVLEEQLTGININQN